LFIEGYLFVLRILSETEPDISRNYKELYVQMITGGQIVVY